MKFNQELEEQVICSLSKNMMLNQTYWLLEKVLEGLPIGAFCSSREMMKKFEYKPSLGHISTFGGNPVIASAGLSVLETLENEKILEKIKEKEKLIRSLLKHKKIKSINGTGLMLAIILERKSDAEKLVKESMGKGLILFYLLWNKLAVRITPPLNISDRDLIKVAKLF